MVYALVRLRIPYIFLENERLSTFLGLQLNHDWKHAYRLGEAQHPGPSLTVASVNITSLFLHYEQLLCYDIILLQETRLTLFGQHHLQQLLDEQGYNAIWGPPRPNHRDTTTEESISGKCGGVALVFKKCYQFQNAPDFLLEPYPLLHTHRFVHAILSTEWGPCMHFMSVYGYTGSDVHVDAQTHNNALFQTVFEYASTFGNTPVYIGMDANTDTMSSSSLSQAYLSQRWYDVGLLFSQLQDQPLQATCFAKGTTIGRRIDYIFANSPAVLAIQHFHVETEMAIPTHRPLVCSLSVELFSNTVTRLSLPSTIYDLPKPSNAFLNTFHSLFDWDISKFSSVDDAYTCWSMWSQQYLTLLTSHDFHSRGASPCIKTGQPATPISRELPATYRPYATLFNQTVSAISQLPLDSHIPLTPQLRRCISRIRSSASTLLSDFHPIGTPFDWLPSLRNKLTEHRLREQQDIRHQRKEAWHNWTRDTWALRSKKIYQLVKGKFVEPFTCLQHEGQIITDRSRIDTLLQTAWNPIFAKYPSGENKAHEYCADFLTDIPPLPVTSLPPLTLDDFHYVLSNKLRKHAATGMDGWRPHEIKHLPDCLLSALIDVFHLCEQVGHFPSSFYYSYTTLIPK